MPAECPDCKLEFFEGASRCPHCGRPSRFPNVVKAREPAEVAELDARYAAVLVTAGKDGLAAEVAALELAVETSQAVIARFPAEVERLAFSDRELYATWYDALDGGVRHPKGEKWDIWRSAADEAFFPRYREEVRFGALTISGRGTKSYGECFLIARTDMIAHRASVFEENTVMFLVSRRFPFDQLHDLPKGHRADWARRGRLAVVKHAAEMKAGEGAVEAERRLLVDGDGEDDIFIEVHIHGPLTIRTFEKVIWTGASRRSVKFRALEQRLRRYGVALEVG